MFCRLFFSACLSVSFLCSAAHANGLKTDKSHNIDQLDVKATARVNQVEGVAVSSRESLRLARLGTLRPTKFALPEIDAPSNHRDGKAKHVSLVLVGDTGFAPSRVRPRSTGVSKYGNWQTWQQTTSTIRPHINGDINFANMESVVSANANLRARPKAFNFMTHPNGVRHLADIGFDVFSMANNHSFDYGAAGVRDSVRHMNELVQSHKIVHAGVGLNRTQAAATPIFVRKDTKFAFGAIGIGASSGGLPRATSKRPGQLNLYNNKDNDLLMKNLSNADVDYRILSVHRGIERDIRAGRDEISRIRQRMLSQGNVDLVIGHHAHVARGVEINNGRLVFYGLGNFLHQGTANMASSGGCRDYSLLARVHLTKHDSNKPQLAAVEIIPITATHMRPKQMKARKAARRIAILNGLASQFDDQSQGAQGVRFNIRADGTGLYCTKNAQSHETTAALCKGYSANGHNAAKIYKTALRTCGRSFGPAVFAKLRSSANPPKSVEVANITTLPKNAQETKVARVERKKAEKLETKKVKKKTKRSKKRVVRKKRTLVKKARFVSKKRLARMTKAQQKRYWTRYWYIKRGRKIPKHLR